MKKQILKLSVLLGLTIAIVSAGYGQTPDSNTAPQATPTPASNAAGATTVSTDQTVSFLLDQNERGRELIKAQDARIRSLESEAAAEKENGDSIGRSYAAAQKEIESLRTANEALHKAIALNEKTVALIQSDRDKWKDKAKKEMRAKYKAYIITAGVIALRFFIP